MVWARMVSPSNCTNTSAGDNHSCNIKITRNNNAGKLPVYYYTASFFAFIPTCFFGGGIGEWSFEGNGGIIEKNTLLDGKRRRGARKTKRLRHSNS